MSKLRAEKNGGCHKEEFGFVSCSWRRWAECLRGPGEAWGWCGSVEEFCRSGGPRAEGHSRGRQHETKGTIDISSNCPQRSDYVIDPCLPRIPQSMNISWGTSQLCCFYCHHYYKQAGAHLSPRWNWALAQWLLKAGLANSLENINAQQCLGHPHTLQEGLSREWRGILDSGNHAPRRWL